MAQEYRQPIVTTIPLSPTQPPAMSVQPPPKKQLTALLDETTIARMEKAAQLAFRLGVIKEPTMDALLNLWIEWGFNGLRSMAMERAGFR